MELLDLPPLVDDELELHVYERTPADPALGWVPAYKFEMRVHGHHAGEIDLRLGDTERLRMWGGHIGYSVDRPYRGRHLAARAVRLVLVVARQHGMRELWITCNPDNDASRRTCELAGGEMIEIVDVPPDLDLYKEGDRQKCRFRFQL